MRLKTLEFFFECFAEEQMNLLYTGDFTDELTDKLIDLNNYQFNKSNELNRTQRKVGFLIAECFQNIVRHGDLSAADSYFHTQNNRGVFSVVSGNIVQNDMIDTLKTQLEQLNKLTSDELKETYRKALADGSFSERGGAGLGLIEMARKTKNKLSFSFSEIDADKSYFYFQLRLKTPDFVGEQLNSNLDNSIALKKKMLKDDIFLIYKGDFSEKIKVPIQYMLENSITSSNQKAMFSILMEFLQHISRQGSIGEEDSDGMLFMGQNKNEYGIGGVNTVLDEDIPELERVIKQYTNVDKKFLDAEYDRLSKDGNKDSKTAYRLGIIDISRRSSSVDFEFRKTAEGESAIALMINTSI